MEMINYDVIVVGTGAAGYNAANRIRQGSKKSVAIVTEGVNCGTSRNTGSDKQTYYKLGLGGSSTDSVRAMAENLFAGGSVDGDTALCEAALSSRCFFNLCELGVPFPVNRYGEYVGYKTDHDPYARATSAGPLTSKFMTEALERQASDLQIPVYDHLLAVEVLKDDEGVCGLLCLDTQSGEYQVFCCGNIILATGGPAGIYADSVYPACHTGSTGLALAAGASLQNMTEWQYGLASIAPRWNVSGTYMQVLPRFVSVDPDGTVHEFLDEYFDDRGMCLSMVFKKGYEWPFDSRKALTGSSVIDLLVYRETVLRGRRVFLDFRSNPFGADEVDYASLTDEAREYLENAGACFGTPIERLLHMNAPAVELYRSKGVDITKEPLEIALCAQHSNGGLSIDLWWQTNVPGLFAAGEAAGSHGVYRPGGSALNAGQVGSLRAAQYITHLGKDHPLDDTAFDAAAQPVLDAHRALTDAIIGGDDTAGRLLHETADRMSAVGGPIRNVDQMRTALAEVQELFRHFTERVRVPSADGLMRAYRLRDVLIAQSVVLSAMIDYTAHGGHSRGSALYTAADGEKPANMEELFRFVPDHNELDGVTQEVRWHADGCTASWRAVHPLPAGGGFFENVWREYRENGSVY